MKRKIKMMNIRIGLEDDKRINTLSEKLKMNKTEAVLFAVAQLHNRIVG